MNSMISPYRFLGLMLLMAAFFFASASVRGADEHAHDAVHGKLMLNDGQKWITDAPLQLAMNRISKAVGTKLPAIHEDRLDNTDYVALGKTIDDNVAYMVNNCQLPADSDAMLHLVLAEMVQGSEAMQGKKHDMKARAGAVKVVMALRDYGKYFDHPNWQPPTH